MVLTRAGLARELTYLLDLKVTGYKEGYKIVNAILDTIMDGLQRGEMVKIPGFGTFYTRRYEGRSHPTPQGKMCYIEARTVVRFRPSPTVLLDANRETPSAMERRYIYRRGY